MKIKDFYLKTKNLEMGYKNSTDEVPAPTNNKNKLLTVKGLIYLALTAFFILAIVKLNIPEKEKHTFIQSFFNAINSIK